MPDTEPDPLSTICPTLDAGPRDVILSASSPWKANTNGPEIPEMAEGSCAHTEPEAAVLSNSMRSALVVDMSTNLKVDVPRLVDAVAVPRPSGPTLYIPVRAIFVRGPFVASLAS